MPHTCKVIFYLLSFACVVFYFTKEKDAARRALLRDMLNSDHESQGRLVITITNVILKYCDLTQVIV